MDILTGNLVNFNIFFFFLHFVLFSCMICHHSLGLVFYYYFFNWSFCDVLQVASLLEKMECLCGVPLPANIHTALKKNHMAICVTQARCKEEAVNMTKHQWQRPNFTKDRGNPRSGRQCCMHVPCMFHACSMLHVLMCSFSQTPCWWSWLWRT